MIFYLTFSSSYRKGWGVFCCFDNLIFRKRRRKKMKIFNVKKVLPKNWNKKVEGFVCVKCGEQQVFRLPFSKEVWECGECGTVSSSVAIFFRPTSSTPHIS